MDSVLTSILTQLDALNEELAARQRANAKLGAICYELSGNQSSIATPLRLMP